MALQRKAQGGQMVFQYHLCSSNSSSLAAEVIAHYHDAGMKHAGGSPYPSQGMALCGGGLVHPSEGMNHGKCS